MSSMIQKPENTAAIAAYIARIINTAYDSNGIQAPEKLENVLFCFGCKVGGVFEEKRIYEQLARLNYAAYNGRYRTAEAPDEYQPHDISHRAEWENGRFIVADWHYKLFKMIQFYNYQCAEDVTRGDLLREAMEAFEKALALFIVENSAAYAAQNWE